MAEKSSIDPSAQFREFVAQFEKGFNALANQTMATDEFAGATHQAMNAALRVQQMMGAAMATYLATMNLPSRADVTALGDRLASIEAHLARIALALDGGAAPADPPRGRRSRKLVATVAKKPPRTKRPPAGNAR